MQEARAIARLRQLTFSGMTGARVLGLVHDAVVFLVEQLQGAGRCQRHNFRFFKQFNQEDDLPVNPSGCARSELYLRYVVQRSSLPSCLYTPSCTLATVLPHMSYPTPVTQLCFQHIFILLIPDEPYCALSVHNGKFQRIPKSSKII